MKKLLIGLAIAVGSVVLVLFIVAILIEFGTLKVQSPESSNKLTDSISVEKVDRSIIHKAHHNDSGIGMVIFENGINCEYIYINQSSGDTLGEIVKLIADPENGGDIYKYTIISGVDSGDLISVDRFMNVLHTINSKTRTKINSYILDYTKTAK